MNFDERLQKAIERGERRGSAEAEAARRKAMTEDELRQMHTQYRLQLSEHIERCLETLPNHFPGFRLETIYGERGWGAGVRRDDIRIVGGRRADEYSRLELTIRPISSVMVVDLSGKGTIRNKEAFTRTYFEKIEDADPQKFEQLIDAWVLEYAEMYAAQA